MLSVFKISTNLLFWEENTDKKSNLYSLLKIQPLLLLRINKQINRETRKKDLPNRYKKTTKLPSKYT